MKVLSSPELMQQMAEVEQHILRATRSREPIIADASTRLAASGGKRLRPVFVLLGGAFGKEPQPHLTEVAAAVELLHMATLVHDDIIDDSPTRRGEPTVQARFGKDIAVFTGDFLLTRALLLMSSGRADDRLRDLARAMVHICEGEVGQYADRFRAATLLRYLKRIHGKTAALFALSLSMGAHQTGADGDVCRRLSRYGMFFGMAFQIYDDMLDYVATTKQVGKPVGHDVLSGVYTLPLLMALKDARVASPLRDLLTAREEVAASRVVDLVRSTDALAKSQRLINRYIKKAMNEIDPLADCSAKAVLQALPGELFGQ